MTNAIDIEARGLSKSFGGNAVLHDVSFHVPAGSSLSLLGPSGCGKSTTLSILAGITRAGAGEVLFGGKPMNDVALYRRRVGVVFQSYALFPHMTVRRNIEFGPRSQRRPKAEVAEECDRALALTRLTPLADRLPRDLSGGQRQRVAIARALASRPDVLLMDEPLSSLDANLREEMQFEIRELQRTTGLSMVFVTHDQQEAMAVGDQVGVLMDGRMRQVGTPSELYEEPVDVDVARFLGKANLLPVTVVSLESDHALVVNEAGERWSVATASGNSLTAGSPALVMVRPEAVRFSDAVEPGANSAKGRIQRASFLGREASVVVGLGYATVELRCPTAESGHLRPGMDVTLVFDPQRATVFTRPDDWRGVSEVAA